MLTRDLDGQLDYDSLRSLVRAMVGLIEEGFCCILVSSGAVGAGTSALNLEQYPTDIPTRQACAAVGQTKLMHAYEASFREYNLKVAQLLLTSEDLDDKGRLDRLKDTLQRLAQVESIIPIINENDCIAVEELSFGDNDMLSVRIAKIVSADRLILLTSVDGLMGPEGGEYIPVVEDVNKVLDFSHGDRGKFSMGGMASKLKAVKSSVDSGIETIIANGRHPERLVGLSKGLGVGTIFKTNSE